MSKAARDLAALDVSYTKIVAPRDGLASKKSVVVGQMLGMGQPVVQIVPVDDAWVTANFKETQLAKMRLGQSADIEVDAYPGMKLKGTVQSFSGATGARFSLLPAENATGNFTKVVQRVPVRIQLEDASPDDRCCARDERRGHRRYAEVALRRRASGADASERRRSRPREERAGGDRSRRGSCTMHAHPAFDVTSG